MEINKKILSIPPYISTSWNQVTSLYVKEEAGKPVLMVALNTGSIVEVPHQSEKTIGAAFQAHAESLKSPIREQQPTSFPSNDLQGGLKFQLPIGNQFAQFGEMMQHNSNNMHAAPLPKSVLDKIQEMAKALGMDSNVFPEPEPHCNCPHCQVARAIHKPANENSVDEEDIVTDEDLKFRDWEIEQTNDKLFNVTNPLNHEEHYQVFLGKPVGCTCGQAHCEHIRAVLRT